MIDDDDDICSARRALANNVNPVVTFTFFTFMGLYKMFGLGMKKVFISVVHSAST